MDGLRFRHVWTVTRPRRGRQARPARFGICWIDDNGRRRRLFYETRDQQRRARQIKEEELNSWHAPQADKPWEQLVSEFGVSFADRSPNHRQRVALVLGRFEAICRPASARSLTKQACELYMASRAAGEPPDEHGEPQPASDATRRSERSILRTFFNWCVGAGYLPANPIKLVHAPPLPQRAKRRPTDEEWVRLLEVVRDPKLDAPDRQAWYLLILLGVVTGLRQSVLLATHFGMAAYRDAPVQALARRHPRGFAIVEIGADDSGVGCLFTFTGKTRKESVVGLPPVVTDRIAERIADLPDGTSSLFPWARWQKKAWERITSAAGLRGLRFHALRGVSGTRAAVAAAERAAAAQLDHGSPAVTRAHYLDLETVARAVAIGARLPPLPPMPRYEPPATRRRPFLRSE